MSLSITKVSLSIIWKLVNILFINYKINNFYLSYINLLSFLLLLSKVRIINIKYIILSI